MPFNLSFTHIMVVAVVALVVLGPERLPGVARQAGNLYKEWKRISAGIEAEVRDVIADFTEPLQEPIAQIRETVTGVPATVAPPGPGASSGAPVAPLAAGLPALGPSTGLTTPGPVTAPPRLPTLAPPADPNTVVPGPPELAVRSLPAEAQPSLPAEPS